MLLVCVKKWWMMMIEWWTNVVVYTVYKRPPVCPLASARQWKWLIEWWCPSSSSPFSHKYRGIELRFQRVPGVIATGVGYTQGHVAEPSYEEVCSGDTGHTEAIQVKWQNGGKGLSFSVAWLDDDPSWWWCCMNDSMNQWCCMNDAEQWPPFLFLHTYT